MQKTNGSCEYLKWKVVLWIQNRQVQFCSYGGKYCWSKAAKYKICAYFCHFSVLGTLA